jgi:hypothetical protein
LPDVNAELEELSMDAGSAPERIGEAHLADQPPNFDKHLGPAGSSSRLPPPEQAKASAMPAYNGCRLYDRERIQNTRRNPIQADEDQAIEVAEDRALRRPSVQLRSADGAEPSSLLEAIFSTGTARRAST